MPCRSSLAILSSLVGGYAQSAGYAASDAVSKKSSKSQIKTAFQPVCVGSDDDGDEVLAVEYKGDVTRAVIAPIARGSVSAVKTSMWSFGNRLADYKLRDIANGKSAGSASQRAQLKTLVTKWVEKDANVVEVLMSTFGVEMACDGLELYQKVVGSFMNVIMVESGTAEAEMASFDFKAVFRDYDPTRVAVDVNKFWSVRSRVEPSIRGTIEYWTRKKFWRACPVDVRQEFDILLRSSEWGHLNGIVWTDIAVFVQVLQAAVVEAKGFADNAPVQMRAHGIAPQDCDEAEGGAPARWNFHGKLSARGNSPQPCPLCNFRKCPLAIQSGKECDVHGNPSRTRVSELAKETPGWRYVVGTERAKAKKSAIQGMEIPATKPVQEKRVWKSKSSKDKGVSPQTSSHPASEASGSALAQSLLDGFPDDDFVGAAERLTSLKFELEADGVFSEAPPSEVPPSTSCHRLVLSCHKQQSPCDLHDSFPQQVEQALLALEVMEAEMSEPLGVTLVDATLSQLGLAVPSESDILSDTIQLSASSIALPTGGACEVLCVPIDAPSLCVAERLALVVALEHALRISVLAGCSGSPFLLLGSAFRRVDIVCLCSSMGVSPPELEYIFSSAMYRRYLSLSGIELRGPVGPRPVLVNLPYLGGGLLFHVGQGQCSAPLQWPPVIALLSSADCCVRSKGAEVKNDNSGTIAKAASDASGKRSLYMKRRVKFIQECQAAGEVVVVYVQSALNRADILTKPVTAKVYAGLRRDAILNIRCAAVSIHAFVAAKMAF